MKRFYRLALLAVAVLGLSVAGASAQTTTFSATATGAEEVPARPSPATANGTFTFDGTGLSWTLTASNITNVFAAHIHLGPPGVNGPIVLTLFNGPLPSVASVRNGTNAPFTGLLSQGRSTTLEGPLAGQPMSALVAQMEAGNAYLNLHTNDNVDPPNTGPGDFPGGEIRGQVQPGGGGGVVTPPPPPPTGTTPPPPPPTTVDPERGRGR